MKDSTERGDNEMSDTTIFMEMHGRYNMVYRVIGRSRTDGSTMYGVETAHNSGLFREEMPEYTQDLNEAMETAEYLMCNAVFPGELYPYLFAVRHKMGKMQGII